MSWSEVNKRNPCPICHKTHWCAVNQEVILCMRVESNHPKVFKTGEVGWVHRLKDAPTVVRFSNRTRATPVTAPPPNWTTLLASWSNCPQESRISQLSQALGIVPAALPEIGCVWAPEHRAYAFPMRDGNGKVIGIRLRNLAGNKWAVPGSKQGIFLPVRENPDTLAVMPEGVSDTAAALSMGLFAIGRPSCSGGVDFIRTAVRRLRISKAVILSDQDSPGLAGAQSLQRALCFIKTTVMMLPCKDLREYLNNGGNGRLFETELHHCVWK